MYLGGQAFRYAVTGSEEALQNCRESLDAMERLYTINPVPGFPSRSFERRGYIEKLADPERWQHAEDPEWDWKATTSSDEAIGHGEVDQREHARCRPGIETALPHDRAGDAVPSERGILVPELRNLRLFRRALAAGSAADALHIRHVTCVFRA